MALVPKGQAMAMASMNPGFGFQGQGFGPQYMYNGGQMVGPMAADAGFGGFNSRFDQVGAVATDVTTVVPGTNTTVVKHICANCGVLRSRKFQAENPIEAGEVAPISYCNKCEKHIKSTDDESSESEVEVRKGKKLKNKKSQIVAKKESSKKTEFVKSVAPSADTHFLHTCAQCGRARSKKYQLRHPIKKGQAPPPAFCGRCQKDETSSEDSNASDSDSGSEELLLKNRTRGKNVDIRERVVKKTEVSWQPIRYKPHHLTAVSFLWIHSLEHQGHTCHHISSLLTVMILSTSVQAITAACQS